jgi:hypothetical protein
LIGFMQAHGVFFQRYWATEVHQQRQSIFEGQITGHARGGLVLQGRHHAVQMQGAKLVEGLMIEHWDGSLFGDDRLQW